MDIAETVRKLCWIPGVSGFEHKAAELVAEMFKPYCDKAVTDKNGNVLAYKSCGLENAKTVLLDAHLDQIGLIVTEVLENGFLRFAPVGGVDPRMLPGNEVSVLADEPIYGVISCVPPKFLKESEKNKAVPIEELYIDTGLHDAKTRIPIGAPVSFRQNPAKLMGDVYVSKCLDDRAGVASILLAMEKLKDAKNLKCDVAVLVSVQEEVTGLGAQSGVYSIRPDYAIAVDVTHGRTPDGPSEGTFQLGSGAAIGMGPNFSRDLTKKLIRTAKAHDIPYEIEVMEGNTGTNAWTIQIVAWGVACALLSIPERYMHTPIEAVSTSDIEAVSELIYRFLIGFDGEAEK